MSIIGAAIAATGHITNVSELVGGGLALCIIASFRFLK